ncbi:MAG: hypothetical protein Q9169_007697 [Polycauliona sp. 2 TL-2023]
MSKPKGSSGQEFHVAVVTSRGLKRSLDDPTEEFSEAQSSRTSKRQHIDDPSNNDPASLPSESAAHIQLPNQSDSSAILQTKLTAILSRLRSRQSIAAATGFAATPNITHDPIAKATQEFTDNQRMMWDAYMASPKVIRPIDWEQDIEAAPTSKKPLQIANRRAEALNRLYDTDQAQPGHAVWIAKNRVFFLPLVKAIARVIGAERDICGGTGGLAKADLQTINAILGIVGVIAAKKDGKIKGSLLAMVQSVLGAERQRLRVLLG